MKLKILALLCLSVIPIVASEKKFNPLLVGVIGHDKQKQQELYTPLLIANLNNDSARIVTMKNNELTAEVPAKKQVGFTKAFNIPFLSISLYLKDFAEAAHGKLFIPQGALSIMVGDKKFGMWENEVGIWCSSETKDSSDETGIKKIMKNVNKRGAKDKQAVAKALYYLLSINNQGEMVLRDATN